jgi:hypothetical protein
VAVSTGACEAAAPVAAIVFSTAIDLTAAALLPETATPTA